MWAAIYLLLSLVGIKDRKTFYASDGNRYCLLGACFFAPCFWAVRVLIPQRIPIWLSAGCSSGSCVTAPGYKSKLRGDPCWRSYLSELLLRRAEDYFEILYEVEDIFIGRHSGSTRGEVAVWHHFSREIVAVPLFAYFLHSRLSGIAPVCLQSCFRLSVRYGGNLSWRWIPLVMAAFHPRRKISFNFEVSFATPCIIARCRMGQYRHR